MPWPHNVTRRDLKIETYRGTGPGGQNRNKRDTAVRITHVPTGKRKACEVHRTQGKNRAGAFRKLARELVPMMRQALREENYAHPVVTGRIRTYNEKRHEVIDHRIATQRFDFDDVLNGNGLEDIMTAVRRGAEIAAEPPPPSHGRMWRADGPGIAKSR